MNNNNILNLNRLAAFTDRKLGQSINMADERNIEAHQVFTCYPYDQYSSSTQLFCWQADLLIYIRRAIIKGKV